MIKLVTFNIRCDYNQDGRNSFQYRRPLIKKKIEEEQPDVICFQEVLPHVAAWLKDELQDYYVIGCGRSEALDNEQVTVAYKKSRLNLVAMDTFWLSDTPFSPGTRYEEQSDCPRVCTEAVLEDMEAKRLFRLFNIHLDHLGVKARIQGLKQILGKVDSEKRFPDIPVILAGDFNAPPDGEEFQEIKKRPEYENLTEGIGITFHGFLPEETKESIDYIYLCNRGQAKMSCQGIEKWEDAQQGIWLSDHYPVCALLRWCGC